MTKAQKDKFRDMLLSVRDRVSRQITALKDDSLTRHDEVNTVEDGTDAFERQFALSLVTSENDALHEIDEALRRIEGGEYGVCEGCGEIIEEPRLKALPFVRMCIGCQSEAEKGKARFHRPPVIRRL